MKILIIVALFAITCTATRAQDCQVLLPKLQGSYKGDCVKGKAHGQGEAEGEDFYIGEFRKGLPEGTGIYSYANGNKYHGSFHRGKPHGKGEMVYSLKGIPDSIVNGYWENGLFAGLHQKPFIIHYNTLQEQRITPRLIPGSRESTITVELTGFSGQSSDLRDFITPLVTLGNYSNIGNLRVLPRNATFRLNNVSYPFRATFRALLRSGSRELDIEFIEPGNWVLRIDL